MHLNPNFVTIKTAPLLMQFKLHSSMALIAFQCNDCTLIFICEIEFWKLYFLKMPCLKFLVIFRVLHFWAFFYFCFFIMQLYFWLLPEVFNSNKLNIGEQNIQTSFSINVRGGRFGAGLIERTSGNLFYNLQWNIWTSIYFDVLYTSLCKMP